MNTMDTTGFHQITAAKASSAERLTFLRKTYSLVLLGIAVFASTAMAAQEVGVVNDIAKSLFGMGWLLMLVWIGSAFLVRAVARTPGVGMVLYLAYAAFLGIMITPLLLDATDSVGPAAIMTLSIFGGLTAYVFVTKHDFSFLGGILAIGMFAMIGIAIVGMIFGLQMGAWYSIGGALLFSGYILYDTSNILHRCRIDEPLPAAIELFVDIVMLFWFILSLLNRD
ncbi:MAG: hypothetical protein CMJ85_10340 [Planctomycetes bacterium]|jgi:FtsH-binding integral membrane protein|nr:hypothetical protein [Planctomycetota bacterium]MDP6423978.1 Bax inhibitor-1 family protein [Planctomycetota bacterium]